MNTNPTDRELLEDAAKAAGIYYWIDADAVVTHSDTPGSTREWNPLTDDGDALRLAVVLNVPISYRRNQHGFFVVAEPPGPYLFETEAITNADAQAKLAATRRAIVRAAASIGKEMK